MIANQRRFACGSLLVFGLICMTQLVKFTQAAPLKDEPPDSNPTGWLKSLRDAALAAANMPDAKARCTTLGEIAIAQKSSGDPATAPETGRKASEAARSLDESKRWSFLYYTAELLYDLGDRDGAHEDIERALVDVSSPNLSAQAQVIGLSTVINTFANFGKATAVEDRNLIEQMISKVDQVPEGKPRTAAMKSIVSTLAYLSRTSDALKYANEFAGDDIEIKADLLVGLVYGTYEPVRRIQPGGGKVGQEVLEARRDRLNLIALSVPARFAECRVDAALVQGFAELGDIEGALKIVDRMGDGPFGPPDKINAIIMPRSMIAIAGAQAKEGKIDQARTTMRQALDYVDQHADQIDINIQSASLSLIVLTYINLGDAAGAQKTVEKLPPGIQRYSLNLRVAILLEKSGHRQEALDLLQRARQAVEDEGKDPLKRATNSYRLSQASMIRTGLGDHEAAIAAFDEITEAYSKVMAAKNIAQIRAQFGDVDGAMAWASSLADPLLRIRALNGVMEGSAAKAR